MMMLAHPRLSNLSRYQAFAIHLLGSAFVLLSFFAIVRWVWFPGPMFYAESGADLMLILLSVDLVLGPAITLIIFNPKKTSLKFDLACVLIFQALFMLYGARTIFLVRPVYLVYDETRFVLVAANEIDPADKEKAKDTKYDFLPLFGPKLVGTREPEDKKLRAEIRFEGVLGDGIAYMPEYYTSYDKLKPEVIAHAKPVKDLYKMADKELQPLLMYEQQRHKEGKDVIFLPLKNKTYKPLFVAVDAHSGEVVGIK